MIVNTTIVFWFELGNWDQCTRAADEFLAESAALGPSYRDADVLACRCWMRLARGDAEAALDDQALLLASARQAKDPQVLLPALSVSAYVLAAAGHTDDARRLLGELFRPRQANTSMVMNLVTDCVLAAEALGCQDQARRWLQIQPELAWFAAARVLADQEFVQAAESFEAMGAVRSAALARLRAAQELAKTGRPAEASHQLGHALGFFRSVGATRFISVGQALHAASA